MTTEVWTTRLRTAAKQPSFFSHITVFPEQFEYTDHRAFNDWQRPYIKITIVLFEKLVNMLKPSKSDFFLYKGKLFTIGEVDGGYGILPLIPEREAYYLNRAGVTSPDTSPDNDLDTIHLHGEQEHAADSDSPLDNLEEIELTLRIICEPADAARFPHPSMTMQAVCRAVAENLELNGRFHIAPVRIAWNPEGQEKQEDDIDG